MINGIVEDYKTASIWKVIYQSFDDYKKQGLIYLWLLKSEKLPAKKMKFYSLLKDYSKSKARFDANYPKSPVHVYEYIPSDSDLKEIDDFIRSKVAMLKKYINVADDDIPPCTAEERWASDNKYAVMKTGRKSAVKVRDSKQEAEKNNYSLVITIAAYSPNVLINLLYLSSNALNFFNIFSPPNFS